MQRGRAVAWLGAAAVMAAAVVALREAQPPADPTPSPPLPQLTRPVQVPRFSADGVLLPEAAPTPTTVPGVLASRTGPSRLRVAWADGLPGGVRPEEAVGYDVRWRSTLEQGQRLVVTPEIELDGLPGDLPHVIEVRTVNADGRRSSPAVVTLAPLDTLEVAGPQLRRFTGLAEPFDGPFSVDGSVLAARWHLSGYSGCTRADAEDGLLAVDLACGADLAVLRSRATLRLAPSGERGRVAVITDAAGPRGTLTVDLVPGPADRVGVERGPVPVDGTDPALPAGTVRVVVDDDGVHVVAAADVPRVAVLPDLPTARPATRGTGVLHAFEVVFDARGVRVLQDGDLVAVSGVTPSWTEAHLLVGLAGPAGHRARVRIDAVAFTGAPSSGPLTYTHPVVLATQRVLGTAETAPGIGISRERLTGARSARLVATVRTAPGMDLDALQLQQGDTLVPARPVTAVPVADGADVTVVSDLLPHLLGPGGPAAISPLVLRAPGAETTVVPITDSYLDIVPLTADDLPQGRSGPPLGQRQETAVPRPAVFVLDSSGRPVDAVSVGARVVVHVHLDGLAGQLGGRRLAGVAGFQLWLSGRLIAGVPTAVDGPGLGGTYRVAVSTQALRPGRQSLELRLVAADATISPSSALTSWHLIG